MKYLLLEENQEQIIPSIKNDNKIELGKGNIEINVQYSSLNYKEMLAFDKKSKVIPKYPMIPGIDFSGIVTESNSDNFKIGDYVLGTGYDLGIKHFGGLSEKVRVPEEWLISINKNDIKKSMIYGTAGLTAGLSIYQLIEHGLMKDKNAPILVTGSTGGVGSIALLILKKLGFTNITALIHNKEKEKILKQWNIHQVIYSSDLNSDKPLQHQNYQFILDTVGGDTLASVLSQVKYNGIVTTCGNASGIKLNTTMFPFILRGIQLIGIDSVYISNQLRNKIWNKLFNEWDVSNDIYIKEIILEEVIDNINRMKKGKHYGRIIVKI